MSRYVKNLGPGKDIAYGHDHATGYFFQLFDGVDEDGNDKLSIDECSLFTKMSKGRMIELMIQYTCPEEQIDLVLLDLEF